jgi:hypothetical protein
METKYFSETLVSIDQSTRSQNPEQQHRHPRRLENMTGLHITDIAVFLDFPLSIEIEAI